MPRAAARNCDPHFRCRPHFLGAAGARRLLTHWACTACRRDPHRSPKARRSFKWIGLVCLLVLSAMFWTVPIDQSVSVLGWLLRVGPLAGAAALLYQLLGTPRDPSLNERLAAIAPASDTVCPFCGTPLLAGELWSCPACGAKRH